MLLVKHIRISLKRKRPKKPFTLLLSGPRWHRSSACWSERQACSLGPRERGLLVRELDCLALDPACGALGQDLAARLPQFGQDHLTYQLLGEAIAGRTATSADDFTQDAAANC